MRTIREAIDAGVKMVYLNNGAVIYLLDVGHRQDTAISTVKKINGKYVYRRIYCEVKGNADVSAIRNMCMHRPDLGVTFFNENEYLIREREMNMFINANGGIDEYRTDYWINGWWDYWR